MFGQALFYVSLPISNRDKIISELQRVDARLPVELDSAINEIRSTMQVYGWRSTDWGIGASTVFEDSILFWTAFPMPDHDGVDVEAGDGDIPELIPELQETGKSIERRLRALGWDPKDWDFTYYDDRPPSDYF